MATLSLNSDTFTVVEVSRPVLAGFEEDAGLTDAEVFLPLLSD